MCTIDAFGRFIIRAVASWLLLAFYTCSNIDADDMADFEACDEVLVLLEDGSQQFLAQMLADSACSAHKRFRKLFGIDPGRVRVRILGSMERWRRVTGRAWYIVATIRDHDVFTQPASSFRKLESPAKPVVHELAHLFIRQVAGVGCPRWIDEGLAQWLAGDRKRLNHLPTMDEIALLDKRLKNPDRDLNRRKSDYELSLAMVQVLIDKLGKDVFISSLERISKDENPLSVVIKGEKILDFLTD